MCCLPMALMAKYDESLTARGSCACHEPEAGRGFQSKRRLVFNLQSDPHTERHEFLKLLRTCNPNGSCCRSDELASSYRGHGRRRCVQGHDPLATVQQRVRRKYEPPMCLCQYD